MEFKKIKIVTLPILLILTIVWPIFISVNPYILHVLVLILFYAVFTQAWNLLAGFAGQVCLAQQIFFGTGAYTSALLIYYFDFFKANPWPTLIAGGFVSLLIGMALGAICFRLRGPYFALATLAAGEVIRLIVLNWDLTLAGLGVVIPTPPTINFIGFTVDFRGKIVYYYITLILTIIIFYLTYLITKSRFGFRLLMIREDEDAATSLGVSPYKEKLLILSVSSFICGIVGALYAQFISYIDASSEPGGVLSGLTGLDVIFCGLLGGAGTVMGPLIGAAIRIGLREYLRIVFSRLIGLDFVIFGAIAILCIMFLRRGLWGFVQEHVLLGRQPLGSSRS